MLMCLAEALLRVPDAATADALIRDKLNAAEWERHLGQSDNVLVNFAAWGLVMTGKVVDPEIADGRPKNVIGRLLAAWRAVIRAAMNQAMKLMGKQFVLGRTIAEALKNGRPEREKGYTYSFDMLGEAALTAEDAATWPTTARPWKPWALSRRSGRGHDRRCRSNCRRCTRATRSLSASGCSTSCSPASASWPSWPAA